MNKLTDEQIKALAEAQGSWGASFGYSKESDFALPVIPAHAYTFARAIEAALAAPPPIAGEPVATDTILRGVEVIPLEGGGFASRPTELRLAAARIQSSPEAPALGVTVCVEPKCDDDALLIDNLFRASLGRDSLAVDAARMALRLRMNELRAQLSAAPDAPAADAGQAGSEDEISLEWEHPCPFRGEPTSTPIGKACPACGVRAEDCQ